MGKSNVTENMVGVELKWFILFFSHLIYLLSRSWFYAIIGCALYEIALTAVLYFYKLEHDNLFLFRFGMIFPMVLLIVTAEYMLDLTFIFAETSMIVLIYSILMIGFYFALNLMPATPFYYFILFSHFLIIIVVGRHTMYDIEWITYVVLLSNMFLVFCLMLTISLNHSKRWYQYGFVFIYYIFAFLMVLIMKFSFSIENNRSFVDHYIF